ncbi:Nitrite reductase NAD(P)H large subunit [Paramagnetospirillum magnetotacticum MS-1]|uniref:Nitrite reductase NAD(P)H large subunit n=1 Tax=Paramagnetospirillum magnetotacticum MS-1 TaxID=272627 RepID=A0A0C2U7C5_PARME|nr:nitrite reductase large subunit NirB [Paramagnetospirillum magnetotacticum]KIL97372.1 Nitrite reductase NAD(P)H large subunit [Paramagnetospirillum magnetotacticum MS-1]
MNAVPRQKLVVIGNGMAGMRTVEELLAIAPARYDITVFGAEPHPNYNRIMLSSVLAGEKQVDDIVINSRAWYAENGITLHTGDPVVAINRAAKTVSSATGLVVTYDRLLLATGSKPLMPPLPGLDLPGVVAFRDIADVEKMLDAAEKQQRAVVIGGGLLGLEAAWGLKRRGMPVALVHLMPTLMERQLDVEAGGLLQKDLTERGLHFFTSGQTEEIMGAEEGCAKGVKLTDGREIPADLVVVAIGIRPNVDLAKAAGLDINRGIEVGDDMATSDPAIFSVGECVEHRGQIFGLVAPIWEQAKVCASRLAGRDEAHYETPPLSTRLKITGIDVFSAGQLAAQDEADEELVYRDTARGIYKKLVIRSDRVVGAVMYGDVADGSWYFQLIREKADVSAIRDRMIFGQAYADTGCKGHGGGVNVAAMSDDAQVCGCNGVSKGAIVKAITEKGLTSLDEVKAHTKASASCGQCASVVQAILAHVTGEVVESKAAGMCGCTDLSHDEVRKEILRQELKNQDAVRSALGWRHADGCAKCRPALNYYLLCAWPAEYVDDYQSRFINERAHANIQKDGTYSVIPRMWGGLTNPTELRAIADVVDKFKIPTVKVTGGQRLDLLGVRKEDLPAVWADLGKAGLVSGHGYAKGLRTVKTCVGSEWCRFGTQDSTGLGVKLEKMMWGSWTPHKVKLAVSGCPRNCAEATIKDMGVVCVEAGYDISVGGNGGIELRGTDHLVRVATEAEVLEYCAAFMQIYREEAHYLERTAPWVERVGMDYVTKRVVEDEEGRKAAHARFLFSQKYAQTDPWAERASGAVDAHEFKTLAEVG